MKTPSFKSLEDFDAGFNPEIPWSGYVHRTWIRPNPKQPRSVFTEEDLGVIKDSLVEVGQQQAVSVLLHKDDSLPCVRFMIHNGERKWRALGMINPDELIFVTYNPEISEDDLHLKSLAANFCSLPHTHGEIIHAIAYETSMGRNVETIAKALGRSRVWVYNYLSLSKLHPELREKMDMKSNDRLRLNIAILLSKYPTEEQLEKYEEIQGMPSRTASASLLHSKRARKRQDIEAKGVVGKKEKYLRDDRRKLLNLLERTVDGLGFVALMEDGAYENMDYSTTRRMRESIAEIGKSLKKVLKKIEELAPKDKAPSQFRIPPNLQRANEIAREKFGVDQFEDPPTGSVDFFEGPEKTNPIFGSGKGR